MKRDELLAMLFDNMQTLKRGMYANMQHMFGDLPVSRSQLELLHTIKHYEPISSKQLAAQLHLTPGAISQLAEGLEAHMLIERHIEPTDRRIQQLRLSPKGAELLKRLEQQRRKRMEHVMRNLSDDELATWVHIQEKLIQEFAATIPAEKATKKGDK